MTSEESTYHELSNSSERGLRGELALWGYEPSEIISKEILINMLMQVYFGGDSLKECENCGGQGIDPNDDGTGTFLCEICGGSGEITI